MDRKKIESQIKKLKDLMMFEGLPNDAYEDAKANKEKLEKMLKDEPAGEAKAKPEKKEKREKASKNREKAKPVDVDDDLAKCKELIAANRKPRKEPVQHNRSTRFINAMKSVVNALSEGFEDDPKKLEEIKKDVTLFEIKCKEKYLGLKVVKASPELKEKMEKKIESAEEKVA